MRFAKRISLVLVMAMVSLVAMAQVTTASLSGTVSDSQESIPAAVVTATYGPTGIVYHAVANNNGIYQFNNIAAGGPYTIEVSSLGYANLTVKDVYLNLADNNRLDLRMHEEALGLSEVTVTAQDMSNMSTDRAGSVTAISAKTMSVVPTTSRSMNDMMVLTPQATTTTNGFAVGGGNYRQSYVTVDGAAFNNGFGIGSNLPGGGTPISLDALDQMAISLTPYDVRQSGFVGGAIQTTTKSGTNEWKLAVYDYFTCDKMQGKKYGEKEEKDGEMVRPELTLTDMLKNTVGFTLGGPIVKDKLFFFINAEYDVDNAPGQTYLARPGDGSTQEMGGQYKRPTEDRMNMMSDYLKEKYGYDPGAYQGYSYNTPDYKLFGRLDWNVNHNHRLTLRYSYTHNYYTTSPSTSVSPFGSTALYDRNSYGRASKYALYYQSACYNQEQNFSSLAAEWNARFAEGRGTNTLRATYSHQYEPRSWNGGFMFPTVDILENVDVDGTDTRAVYTTLGMDPFTYGNLRDVRTVQVTNDLTYQAGFNNITVGAQFEYNNAKNGYMQMGNAYYLYGSWDDFVNGATPLAFAITHGNNDELQQQFPTIVNTKYSLYAQDEMNLHKNFKLTAGIRLELPVYPNIDFNENKDFTSIFENTTGWKTSDVPNAYLSVSPRVGFNWDIMGNRRIVLRGGTGIYTGTLPMVWLVSAVGNSNVMQAQTILSGSNPKLADIKFPTNFDGTASYLNEVLENLYGGTFQAQDLTAPSSTTILDKHLKLPTTWKSSLAIDFNLPSDVKISIEGVFNKDIHSVVCRKEGLIVMDTLVLIDGVDERLLYGNDPTCKNNAGQNITPYYLTNSQKNGYYASATAKIEKSFNFGLNLMAAYTYSKSLTLNDGLGDQVTSVFSTNTFAVNGSNNTGLGQSSYVTPHRVIANISYRIAEGRNAATTLSLFYEGSQIGYIGTQYSYTRWTPTYSADITGQGGAYNTIYIPTSDEMSLMNWKTPEDQAGFENFIMENRELASHRGEYATRGCMHMPWHNQLNFKFLQSIIVADGSGRKHNMEIGLDIKNVLNLLNPAWGNYKTLNNTNVLTYNKSDNTISYNPSSCQWSTLASTASTWNMMLSLRYFF